MRDRTRDRTRERERETERERENEREREEERDERVETFDCCERSLFTLAFFDVVIVIV